MNRFRTENRSYSSALNPDSRRDKVPAASTDELKLGKYADALRMVCGRAGVGMMRMMYKRGDDMCNKRKKLFDEKEVRRTIEILKPDGELFEVRIIKGRKIWSGYFRDAEKLLEALDTQNLEQCNVYLTLHHLHEGCSARWQYEKFIEVGWDKLPTTSDNDVVKYKYIPVDLDPVRPAGISSSEEELQEAACLLEEIKAYMEDNGFHECITAFSGNGYHLLYLIDWPVSPESTARVEEILKMLDADFSTSVCHVDTTNSNPSRIFKLYGTVAQKGRSTDERPHRLSRIIKAVHDEKTAR